MKYRLSKRSSPQKSLIGILNVGMALAYLSAGAFLFISPDAGRLVPTDYRIFVAVALVFYGIFRAVRAYFSYFTTKNG